MKRDAWIVGDYAIRPAGPPDRCFYRGQPGEARYRVFVDEEQS